MSPDLEKRLSKLESEIKDIREMVSKILEMCTTAFTDREMDPILEAKEVAALLNIDINIIYAKCANGQIPFERFGKKYKFKKSEIVAWWGKQQATTGSGLSADDYANRYLQQNPIRG